MAVSHRRQLAFEHSPRFGDAPLHGTDRRLKHLAHFFIRVFTGAREQQCVPQFARQSTDQSPHIALQFRRFELGRLRFSGGRHTLDDVEHVVTRFVA